jgi:hypothetical protein
MRNPFRRRQGDAPEQAKGRPHREIVRRCPAAEEFE